MIEYKQGDIFNSKADILVCPVNTVGVMGKGLALQFKIRFPLMYSQYKDVCKAGILRIGQSWLWADGEHCVICFPTKRHWRQPSQIGYIKRGLDDLAWNQRWIHVFDHLGAKSIAFPLLGCGLGGLRWHDVKPIMEEHLGCLTIDSEIWHERSSDNL